jgi:hypothetical protein
VVRIQRDLARQAGIQSASKGKSAE